MKKDFLNLNKNYPEPDYIYQVEYYTVSDNDVPNGSGGINKESYTYGQLRRKPIINEILRTISNPTVLKYVQVCNKRNSQEGFTMYKVNGEYCFWGLRVGPIVKTPSESELRTILNLQSNTAQALLQKVVTPRMLRDITYDLLRNAISQDCNMTTKEATQVIGSQLDCAPHEDASGYIFMVPNWAHNWFRHDGYVAKMLKMLNK